MSLVATVLVRSVVNYSYFIKEEMIFSTMVNFQNLDRNRLISIFPKQGSLFPHLLFEKIEKNLLDQNDAKNTQDEDF